jgi:3'-phosphoadenosine 5'-phosphosulfate (PAPS) 3'-phosphatase
LSEVLDLDEFERLARLFGLIAVRAGEVIMDARGDACRPDYKADGSPVTAADLRADELIRSCLERNLPDLGNTAAGHTVLLAAGGTVTDLDGRPLRYGKLDYRNGDFVAWGTPEDVQNERTRHH